MSDALTFNLAFSTRLYGCFHLFGYSFHPLATFSPVVCIQSTGIIKTCMEDTTLSTTDALGNRIVVPVPKGSDVTIDFAALHYNPRYWDEPHAFRPSRFLKVWPRDAFLPFSIGTRACLGRKFFETEGIAILTKMISRYKIEVKEEPQFAGETFEQKKARILKTRLVLTLTPIKVPLVFKLRNTKTAS